MRKLYYNNIFSWKSGSPKTSLLIALRKMTRFWIPRIYKFFGTLASFILIFGTGICFYPEGCKSKQLITRKSSVKGLN